MKGKILVIDDKSSIGAACKRVLENEDYSVVYRQDGHEGLKEALGGDYDLILLDLLLPGIEGMEILKALREKKIASDVIIITGHGSVQTAVEAMKLGAADYINKPFSADELLIHVERVVRQQNLISENLALKRELSQSQGSSGIIGESESMKKVLTLIDRVAPTESNILITGESGTGKEVIAQTIHRKSLRSNQAFIACDCNALTPTLLESELFGHLKGSYSGAIANKQGLFEIADKGTLFLDEVSNISPDIQMKLLRIIETRKIRRVGDVREKIIDIRLISASNRDLTAMVEEGSFRNDLFYRLQVIPILLPPLRERRGDISRLAKAFLDQIGKTSGIRAGKFSPEALEMLEGYSWPGNIRELRNIIERVAILCDSEEIGIRHLPEDIRHGSGRKPGGVPSTWDEFREYKKKIKDEVVDRIEKEFLTMVLERSGGNISKAAAMIGMQRTNLHALLKKHSLSAG